MVLIDTFLMLAVFSIMYMMMYMMPRERIRAALALGVKC